MSRNISYFTRFNLWRRRNISDRNFMIFLSIIIGFMAGMAAVIVKNLVHFIKSVLIGHINPTDDSLLFLVYPLVGIALTIFFIKVVLRQHIGDGVPSVLKAISKNNGIIKIHNTFSSIISSALTVGFGGSVGLEGPTVITGAAIGSNIGQRLHLNYRQTVQLLVFASAGAMSAIFKSPIAAIVFVLEVIMFDFSMASLLPLLIASVTGTLTSFAFLGQDALYPFNITHVFSLQDTHFYILLGIITGFVSLYATRILLFFQEIFEREYKWYWKFLIAGTALGLLIFIFPSLFGEGFEATNSCLHGHYNTLFDNSLFHQWKDSSIVALVLLGGIIIFKMVATALTFGSGGIGGIFASTLFTGAHTGLLFAMFYHFFGMDTIPASHFALMGMAGLIAGVIHAPLTAIFLIAEITGGYELFLPLMITSTISYATVRAFSQHSVYTNQLAKARELLTHNKDQSVLTRMSLGKLIEKNIKTINIDNSLKDLISVISESNRNIIPVIDEDKTFYGIVLLDDIRHIMFKPELYENTSVRSLMVTPIYTISPKDCVEDIAQKFQRSGKYNLPVIDNGKYLGFVSRVTLFSEYRRLLKEMSDDS